MRNDQYFGIKNAFLLKQRYSGEASIGKDLFNALKSLKLFNISFKTLKNLPSWLFRSLMKLDRISLHLDHDDLKNVWFDISDNEKLIRLPNKLFSKLKLLKILNLEIVGSKELTKDIWDDNLGMLENWEA